MARTYAGILGILALATSLARGIALGGSADAVLWTAWCSLLVLAAVGGVLGWIAERTVQDSVHGRIAAELAGQEAAKTATPRGA